MCNNTELKKKKELLKKVKAKLATWKLSKQHIM